MPTRLDRAAIPDNILDRMAELERRVRRAESQLARMTQLEVQRAANYRSSTLAVENEVADDAASGDNRSSLTTQAAARSTVAAVRYDAVASIELTGDISEDSAGEVTTATTAAINANTTTIAGLTELVGGAEAPFVALAYEGDETIYWAVTTEAIDGRAVMVATER